MAFSVQTAFVENMDTDDALLSLFFFDTHPGGVGLCTRAFDELTPILKDVIRLIEGCGCLAGCPSCIGPVEDESSKTKDMALALARGFHGLAPVESDG